MKASLLIGILLFMAGGIVAVTNLWYRFALGTMGPFPPISIILVFGGAYIIEKSKGGEH